MGEKRDTYGAFVPEYIINSYDWYVLHGPVHEAGIRIGGKSLRMDGTDTEREPELIFCLVNSRLVRSQSLENVLIVALNLRDECLYTVKPKIAVKIKRGNQELKYNAVLLSDLPRESLPL